MEENNKRQTDDGSYFGAKFPLSVVLTLHGNLQILAHLECDGSSSSQKSWDGTKAGKVSGTKTDTDERTCCN